MPPKSNDKNLIALEQWAGALACPACLSPIRFEEGRVVCTNCARVYPVIDGIPVLIAERATLSSETR